MLAKSLVIFISVGVSAGFFFGLFLVDVQDASQVVYVDGPSISITSEKYDYKKGEDIKIHIINSGNVPLFFQDPSYSLRVTGLSGMLIYSPTVTPALSKLEPKDDVEFTWNQTKNDGNTALEGLYKIQVTGLDESKKKIESSITINIKK